MLWSFIAICLSAWIFIDASYRGLIWQRWLFKLITSILLLLLSWQAPVINPIRSLIFIGLCASLVGDFLILLPHQTMIYAISSFFLSYLFYAFCFFSQMKLSLFWPLPLILLVIGILLISIIWTRLEEMRWPICTFITMTLVMVWLAGEMWFFLSTASAMSAFFGSALLLIGNIIWVGTYYHHRFCTDNAIASSFYFVGHFLIIRSLYF